MVKDQGRGAEEQKGSWAVDLGSDGTMTAEEEKVEVEGISSFIVNPCARAPLDQRGQTTLHIGIQSPEDIPMSL